MQILTYNIIKNNTSTFPDTINDFLNHSYNILCEVKNSDDSFEITYNMLLHRLSEGEKFTFLDVRNSWEEPKIPVLNGLNIPLHELSQKMNIIPNNHPLLVYCQKGSRSLQALNLLKSKGFTDIYHLKGGVESWIY